MSRPALSLLTTDENLGLPAPNSATKSFHARVVTKKNVKDIANLGERIAAEIIKDMEKRTAKMNAAGEQVAKEMEEHALWMTEQDEKMAELVEDLKKIDAKHDLKRKNENEKLSKRVDNIEQYARKLEQNARKLEKTVDENHNVFLKARLNLKTKIGNVAADQKAVKIEQDKKNAAMAETLKMGLARGIFEQKMRTTTSPLVLFLPPAQW